MGNKGLAAALAGLARGGASHVRDKRDREREQEDQRARLMQAIQMAQLQARLQQESQAAGFDQQNLNREDSQAFSAEQGEAGRGFTAEQNSIAQALQRELAQLSESGAERRSVRSEAGAMGRARLGADTQRDVAEVYGSRTPSPTFFTDPETNEIFMIDPETLERRGTGQKGSKVGTERAGGPPRLSSDEEDLVNAAAARELMPRLTEDQQRRVQQMAMGGQDPLIAMLTLGFVNQEDAMAARERVRARAIEGKSASGPKVDPRLEMLERLEALEDRLDGAP